jgi:hypothetical protein
VQRAIDTCQDLGAWFGDSRSPGHPVATWAVGRGDHRRTSWRPALAVVGATSSGWMTAP